MNYRVSYIRLIVCCFIRLYENDFQARRQIFEKSYEELRKILTKILRSFENLAPVIIIIIINKVLIKVTLNKVIAGALYIVICG